MPIIAKIGQLEGSATVLSDPQKFVRAAQVYCSMHLTTEELAGMSDLQKLEYVANGMAVHLRRTVVTYLREQAARTAAEESEATEGL